jgi:hypothetical protein
MLGLGALIGIEFLMLTVPTIPYRLFWAFVIMAGASTTMYYLKVYGWAGLLGFGALLIVLHGFDRWRAGLGRK